MDNINELLQKLSELTPDELTSLKDSILAEFDSLETQEDRTRETVESMTSLAAAFQTIKEEEGLRKEEEAELAQLAQDAATTIKGEADADAAEGDEAEEVDEASEAAPNPVEDEDTTEDESTEDVVEDVVEDEADSEETPEEDEDEKLNEFSTDTEVSEPVAVTELASDETTLVVDGAVELANITDNDSVDASVETPSESATELALEDTNTESVEEHVNSSINTEFSAPDANSVVETAVPRKLASIVASADLPGYSFGAPMPNVRAVAQALLERRRGMGHTSGGDGEQALVASFSHESFYGEDRTLDHTDTEGNRAKIDAVVASLKAPEALVAAGGLTAPVDTSWDIYEIGETLGRPVKESLPSFNADRGGLRFLTPPVLKDLEGAVSIWTLQDDIAAETDATKTKPSIRIKAGEEVTVYLEAMPLILTFGNLAARAFPELVERHIALSMVWQARFAESRTLKRIGDMSTKVTATKELGAARDLLVQLDQATAGFRNRHRLDEEAPFRAMFPAWFKKALRADLVKQIPGDGQEAAFDLADATIDKWFAQRKVNVTWFIDGETGSNQIMGAQADGALNEFPANVVWYLFPEGSFLFLDGGTLDLGLVRDSTLNATNDYKMFLETFENVAFVGVEALRISSEVAIAGASAGTVDTISATV